MIATVTCPYPGCGQELTAHVTYEGGDWVPYGSATVRLPGGYTVEFDTLCRVHPSLSDAQYLALEEQAIDQVAE